MKKLFCTFSLLFLYVFPTLIAQNAVFTSFPSDFQLFQRDTTTNLASIAIKGHLAQTVDSLFRIKTFKNGRIRRK